MRQGLKSALFISACSILLLHFTILLISSLPRQGGKKRLHFWAEYYTYPYFVQSWSLFAPPPEDNYKLLVEYVNLGAQKQDLVLEILDKHRGNVFKGGEVLYLSICNSIHFFEKNHTEQNSGSGLVISDKYWNILEHQALRYLNSTYHLHLNEIKMALLCTNVHNGKKRVYYNSAFAQTSTFKK